MGDICVTLVPASEASHLAQPWQELEKYRDGGLKSGWLWTRAWLEHYGNAVSHQFVIAEKAGKLAGLALLTERRTRKVGIGIRRLNLGFISDRPSLGEYSRLLVAPEAREEFAAGILELLRQDPTWCSFKLNGLPLDEAGPFLRAESSFQVHHEPCRIVDLAAACQTGRVIDILNPGAAARIRRSLRLFGPLDVKWGVNEKAALDILDELIELHQSRWRRVGQPGTFGNPRAVAFHRDVAPQLATRGEALLLRVRDARQTIGCLYALIDKGRALSYLSGLAPFEDNRLKPGMVLDLTCMQECMKLGLSEYDFLASDSRYKKEMSTASRDIIFAKLASPRLRWRPVHAASALRSYRRSKGRSSTY